MATRGARPKPTHLRLVEGTHNVTRHGDREKARKSVEQSAKRFGKLQRPKFLRDHAADAWKRWIAPAYWLDSSREAAAIAFCQLWQEFQEAPRMFPGTKHGQLRAYMSELGLTDERKRTDDPEADKDEFFDD